MFFRRQLASLLGFLLLADFCVTGAFAGGPRWVAGTSYFDPSVLGQPLVWKNGVLNYYTDLGDLSPTVTGRKPTPWLPQPPRCGAASLRRRSRAMPRAASP